MYVYKHVNNIWTKNFSHLCIEETVAKHHKQLEKVHLFTVFMDNTYIEETIHLWMVFGKTGLQCSGNSGHTGVGK